MKSEKWQKTKVIEEYFIYFNSTQSKKLNAIKYFFLYYVSCNFNLDEKCNMYWDMEKNSDW